MNYSYTFTDIKGGFVFLFQYASPPHSVMKSACIVHGIHRFYRPELCMPLRQNGM
jgi:hypothetical protein